MGEKRALLILNMQNDFVFEGGAMTVPGAEALVPRIGALASEFRERQEPVIYLCDTHDEDDPEFQHARPHALRETIGAEVIEDLDPQPGDYIIEKTTWSGFFGTTLEEVLRDEAVDDLVLTGVCTNRCVHYTAADAAMRGYGIEVPEETTAARDPGAGKYALKQIREILRPRRS